MSDMNEVKTKKTKTPKPKAASAKPPFEEALARLEVIVKTMEGDTVSLDESLSLYEEGIALVRCLTHELDEAETRVRVLQKTADGTIQPTEFATTTEDA